MLTPLIYRFNTYILQSFILVCAFNVTLCCECLFFTSEEKTGHRKARCKPPGCQSSRNEEDDNDEHEDEEQEVLLYPRTKGRCDSHIPPALEK